MAGKASRVGGRGVGTGCPSIGCARDGVDAGIPVRGVVAGEMMGYFGRGRGDSAGVEAARGRGGAWSADRGAPR